MINNEKIQTLITKNSYCVFDLKADAIVLRAIQNAVGHLLDKIGTTNFQSCFETVISQRALAEIEEDLLILDKAFYHLNKEMQERIDNLENGTTELLDIARRNKEQRKLELHNT